MSTEQQAEPLKLSMDLEEPSDESELIEWAKENINEDPHKRDQVISDLRDLIFARGECRPHRIDDAFLLRFLRARHFIIQRAHRLMVNYYDFKESTPEYFKDVELERMRDLARSHIISAPPYKDQQGRRLMIHRLGIWDPSEFSVQELFQLTIGILELGIMEPQFQIQGGIMIFDLSELGISQAWQMTPTIANHIIQIAMMSLPLRVAAIHILHQSWVFDIAFNVFKPLLNEAMRERIFFHGNDLESFHAHIDPSHLPKRYGGIHEDFLMDDWFENYVKHDDRIIQELVDLGYEDFARLRKDRRNKRIQN